MYGTHLKGKNFIKGYADTNSRDSLQGLSALLSNDNKVSLLASKPQDFENDSSQHRQKPPQFLEGTRRCVLVPHFLHPCQRFASFLEADAGCIAHAFIPAGHYVTPTRDVSPIIWTDYTRYSEPLTLETFPKASYRTQRSHQIISLSFVLFYYNTKSNPSVNFKIRYKQ